MKGHMNISIRCVCRLEEGGGAEGGGGERWEAVDEATGGWRGLKGCHLSRLRSPSNEF